MENMNRQQPPGGMGSRLWTGLILFLAGLLLLARQMGAPLPDWLFTWPMILILVGIMIGIKDKFQNPGSWIILLIGSIFLADRATDGLNLRQFIAPLILIIIGLVFLIRPRIIKGDRCGWGKREDRTIEEGEIENTVAGGAGKDQEYVNVNSVFGGCKKNIFSKDFRGGIVNCFMGGAELNLSQAGMKVPAILEINNVFGGTKLVVPSDWNVKNEVTAIFGGIDDKRKYLANVVPDPEKSLLIKGSCLFGGIDIVSY